MTTVKNTNPLLNEFSHYLLSHSFGKSTHALYTSDIRQFLTWRSTINSDIDLPITPTDISLYKRYLLQKTKSSNSINRNLSSLRKFNEFLTSKGIPSFMENVRNIEDSSGVIHPRLKKFLEYIRLTKKNSKTIQNYNSDIQQFSTWYIANYDDVNISTGHVSQYLMSIALTKKPATVKRTKSTLTQFIAWQKVLSGTRRDIHVSTPIPKNSLSYQAATPILFIIGAIFTLNSLLSLSRTPNDSLPSDNMLTTASVASVKGITQAGTPNVVTFNPSNVRTISITLPDTPTTQVEEDVAVPFVVEKIDYDSLYAAPQLKDSARSGYAVLPPYSMNVKITNSQVTGRSVIQITPTSSTQNKVLYIAKQSIGSFVVALDEGINEPINFVWSINN